MPRFKFDGDEYELVESMLFAESSWIERQSKTPASKLTDTEQLAGQILVTLRRRQVMLTWDDIMGMSLDAFELLQDEQQGSADPTSQASPSSEAPPTLEPVDENGPSTS